MAKSGGDGDRTVRELHPHVEHLGGQVPVGEAASTRGSGHRGVDSNRDRTHEGLELDGRLHGARESGRALGRDGDAKVLMEDAAEFDTRLEQQRLAP